MKIKNNIVLATGIVFAVLAPFLAQAEFVKTAWQFKKEITVPVVVAPIYVKATLDREVLSGSHLQNDIRIIDNNGGEIPYQLVVETGSAEHGYYPTKIYDIVSSLGQTMFVLDLGATGLIHNQVTISASSRNFKKQVSVYASDAPLGHSDNGWRLLTDRGYIFNVTDDRANFTANGTTVSYPQSTSRFMRVVISAGEGGLTAVSQASVYRSEVNKGEEQVVRYPLTIVQNTKEKSTELMVDFGAQGVTSREISFATSDTNFSRRAVVQASTDGLSWRLINEGSLSSIALKSFSGSQLSLSYPESRERYLRVIIFNYDNKPVNFMGSADVRSTIRAVVFEARPEGRYNIYYGNGSASAPRYDIGTLFRYIDTNDFVKAVLGVQSTNVDFVPNALPTVPFTERYPYLLNITLAVLVIVVGVFIFFYLRSVTKGDLKIEEIKSGGSASGENK